MKILGLNGFGIYYGRIARYFQPGCGYFPYRMNWERRHLLSVMDGYSRECEDEPYIAIGFSDGGTLAHELAATDQRCVGLIVHSGMFREPPFARRNLPVLLIRTIGDRTPTFEATGRAFIWYRQHYVDRTELADLEPDGFPRHQFENGLGEMKAWAERELGFDLPVITKKQCTDLC